MLTVAVLGVVEAYRDGVRLDVPAGKTAELLCCLALQAGVPVRTEALLEDLWAAPTARNTLQSKVSQLRRALGDAALLRATATGYTLVAAPEAVDATRVVQLAAASATARAAGDPAASLPLAREGLALFRGEVLLDAGDWAGPHRTRLEEVRLVLVQEVVFARLDLGAGAELVAELQSLVREHPLREALWAALITALYRADRQADALAAYAALRRLLVDELGIEPSPALQELEHQVLQQSPLLASPGVGPVARSGNVPVPAVPILGRSQDIADVVAALASHHLVTVVGPAGVGKTRLGIEVARQLATPGGVWLVRLDAVAPEAALLQVLEQTLRVTGGEQALHDRLSAAGTVLLLDNCEHLAARVAALVASLLDAVPQLRVLATSQAPLGLNQEHRYQLEPLTQEDSVTLFARRALELRRRFVLDQATTTVVQEICGALDGLPLAIELAASRVRSLSVADIARHLDDRFVLLRDPSGHGPERRRALEAAIGWSYELLFPDDQRGLWALSCFAGTASLDAAEQVLAALGVPARAVLDTISRLVDRSLVIADTSDGGEVRYRLLDSIRTYGRDRLRESGLADVASAAHAAWYAQTARQCDEHIRTNGQPRCLEIVRAERGNVDSALSWCSRHDPLLGLRIALGFGWTWVVLGDGTAGAGRLRRALFDAAPSRDRVAALLLAAWLEASAGDVALAQANLDEAQALAGQLDDDVLVADSHRHQAFLAIQQGKSDLVLQSAAASLATYRPRALAWHTAASMLLAAFGHLMLGNTRSATREGTEAAALLSGLGDSWGVVHAQALLGGIAQAEGRFGDAAQALEHAADESGTLGFVGQAALHRASLARVQQQADDPRAAASYQRAIREANAGGDGRLAATARLNLARLRRTEGDPSSATELLEENQRWYAAAGGGDFALLTDTLLAAVRDDPKQLGAALQAARADRNVEVQVLALDALARLAAASGDEAAATSLLAEADTLAPHVTHLLDEHDRIDKNDALAQVIAT
jgi:predicted ATPase/DNA-binding SARP family transcriptional activator